MGGFGLIIITLLSILFAVIVFTILDRNANRGAAIAGGLVTFVATWLPFGLIIGAVLCVVAFLWAFSKTKNGDSASTPSDRPVA